MSKRMILNEKRDYPLLIYIWKWKVVTTASICKKFFPNHSPFSVYNRLLKLSKFNFVSKVVADNGFITVWTLDKKGFNVIKDELPALREDGFKSENIKHDLYCSAAHQGDFFIDKPASVQTFSEQQLRRTDLDWVPKWVPSIELHRPDGYWFIENKDKNIVVSLELEQSRKNSANYEKLASFYTDFPSHYRVLWIVKGQTLINYIAKILDKASYDSDIHNFVLLKDFLESGWSSLILLGPEKGMTVSKFFYDKACAKPERPLCAGTFQSLLNTKLKHHNL